MDNQLDPQLPVENDTYNLLPDTTPVVNPDQMVMFGPNEAVTSFDIPHLPTAEEALSQPTEFTHNDVEVKSAIENIVSETSTEQTETVQDDGGVSSATKTKVLAALAVVAVAGYIAYWVQEPLQIKADVISPGVAAVATPATPASDSKVADATTSKDVASATTEQIKNVDVSLFGFEPAVLKIDKGTTIIWTNTSTEDQTMIGSSKNADSFTSPVLKSGDTFTHQFDKDGVYEYYSTYNPALKANITVGLGDSVMSTPDLKPAAETTSPVFDAPTVVSNIDSASAVLDSAVAEATIASSNATASDLSASDSSSLSAANLKAAADESLKPAASTSPKKLAKTGPEDMIYVGALMVIAYFNRKKLLVIFN